MFKLIALFTFVAVIAAEPEADPQFVYHNPLAYNYPRAVTTYGNGHTMHFMFKTFTCFELEAEPAPAAAAAASGFKKRSAEADPQYVVPYPYVRPVVYAHPRASTYGGGHSMIFKFEHFTCFEVEEAPAPAAPAASGFKEARSIIYG